MERLAIETQHEDTIRSGQRQKEVIVVDFFSIHSKDEIKTKENLCDRIACYFRYFPRL